MMKAFILNIFFPFLLWVCINVELSQVVSLSGDVVIPCQLVFNFDIDTVEKLVA